MEPGRPQATGGTEPSSGHEERGKGENGIREGERDERKKEEGEEGRKEKCREGRKELCKDGWMEGGRGNVRRESERDGGRRKEIKECKEKK